METQQTIDYNRIALAIDFIRANFKQQPSLDAIAAEVHLSPFHFQRMFRDWAGVTPKQFIQYLSVEHAKSLLKEAGTTLFDAAYETGLSGTGRLHDMFIRIEGMTPGEYKNGGEQLSINYNFSESPFGSIIIASTTKGICYMAFVTEDKPMATALLQASFPNAHYTVLQDEIQLAALQVFSRDWSRLDEVKLHLKGTPFQLKVWETLLKVPLGGLTTYAQLAGKLNNAKAYRAVGTAVGDNPVAFLIPCHRVIKSTGETGQYHWGSNRKHAIIGWEASRTFGATL